MIRDAYDVGFWGAFLLTCSSGCGFSPGIGKIIDVDDGGAGPLVTIISPLDEVTLRQSVSLALIGEVRHPEREGVDGLVAEWFVNGNTACQATSLASDNSTSCRVSLEPGEHTITLASVNADGADGVVTHTVFIEPNLPPEVAITGPRDDIEVREGEPIVFSAVVLDDFLANDALELNWDSSLSGGLAISGFANDNGEFEAVTSLAAGTHVVTVSVVDDGGFVGTDEVTIEVDPANQAPAVDSVFIQPNPPRISDEMLCSYSGFYDANGDPDTSRYDWFVNGVWTGSGATLSDGFVRNDVVRCDVTPSDGWLDGLVVSASVTVANTPPVVSDVAIDPTSPRSDDALICSHLFTDADGDSDQSTIDWLRNGVWISSGIQYGGDLSPADAITCRVTASDGIEQGNVVEVTVVVGNYIPSVSMVSITPDPAYVGDALTCSYAFADQDGQGDASSISWTVDGVLIGNLSTLSAGFSTGDEVMCTVIPNDGVESGTPVSDVLTISKNQKPTCAISSPASGTVAEWNQNVSLVGEASDAEDGALSLEATWSSDQDGTLGAVTPAAGGTVRLDVASLSLGTHIITLAVSDLRGKTCEEQVVLSIQEPPSIAWVGPNSDIRDGEPLVLEVLVDDPELGPNGVSVNFGSDLDGALGEGIVDSSGLTTLELESLQVGQHQITANAVDVTGFRASVTEMLTVVSHDAPSIASVSISPSPAFVGDTLSCSYAGYTDPDGDVDQSQIRWFRDGLFAANGSLLSAVIQKGEQWTCEVTPFDGWLSGVPLSTSIVVSNSPPECSLAEISPSSVDAGTDLTCSYTFDDADGDPDQSTVTWLVDGVFESEGESLSDAFVRGQEVRCEVTPFDGDDAGSPCATEVLVDNGVALVSDVTIEPDPADDRDVLTCSWNFEDVDGDPDQSSQTWSVNGQPPSSEVRGLMSGYGHSCGVDDAGVIHCRGGNDRGQLNGLPTGPGYVRVTMGAEAGCAVHRDGTLSCWGVDNGGVVSLAPTDANYAAVDLWWSAACALTLDGAVVCWGDDVNYHLSAAPSGNGYRDITLSHQGACVIDAEGHLLCWGNDFRGWVSDMPSGPFRTFDAACCHICALDINGIPRCWGYVGNLHEAAAPAGQAYERIGVGTFYECGLRPDGEVDCWGWIGPVSTHYFGQDVPNAGPFDELTVASDHACGRRPSGELSCWGDDSGGQVSTVWSPNVPQDYYVDGFEAGDTVVCEVEAFDGVEVGNSDSAEVVIGASNAVPSVSNLSISPVSASPDEGLYAEYSFVDPDGDTDLSWYQWTLNGSVPDPGYFVVDAGNSVTCGVDRGGKIRCWGSDDRGQISGVVDQAFTQIAVGEHSCGRTVASEILCWGDDASGEVLDAPTGAGFTSVAVGGASCAITDSGDLECWGSDLDGLISERPVSGGYVALAIADRFGCALDGSGLVECWGSDVDGGVSGVPVQPAVNISAGDRQACIVTDLGEVECWGDVSAAPPADANFVSVASSNDHACALNDTGAVVCWGNSDFYTDGAGLGLSGSGWRELSVGSTQTCAVNGEGALSCVGTELSDEVSGVLAPRGPRSAYVDFFELGDEVSCTVLPFDGLDFGGAQRASVTF